MNGKENDNENQLRSQQMPLRWRKKKRTQGISKSGRCGRFLHG
ncbi:hypothetical protein [Mixta calida]|nr:hypothetical protein [Mixta calida]MDU6537163.1 hypothetical protein [Mixta calida]